VGSLVALALSQTELVGTAEIALVIAGIGFGLIGFADDLNGNLPVRVRLTLQLVIAVIVVSMLWRHTSVFDLSVVLVCAVAILWILSFVNAFNFMDGINGISCAETIVAGVAFGLCARHEHHLGLQIGALALVAGSIGFAPFNFPTARVFLGDVGSYFAGAWLAVLVIMGLRASIPAEAMLAPLALYMADTGMTLARRMHRREAWTKGHRQHAYQRLVRLGWSHTQTTGLVFVLVALCSALGSVSLFGSTADRAVADCGIAVLVIAYLALPALIGRRHLEQRQEEHQVKQQQVEEPQVEQPHLEPHQVEDHRVEHRHLEPRALEPLDLEPRALEPLDLEPRALEPLDLEQPQPPPLPNERIARIRSRIHP
jgi:UDP-N-acetylmuramyl pentapeptide phosphotransferase/UDP-N-acetylglucosamine-1-phosphate transferase